MTSISTTNTSSFPRLANSFISTSPTSISNSIDFENRPIQNQNQFNPVDPLFKAASVHLPMKLPKGPLVDQVELKDLIVDEQFQGIPIGFLIGKLRGIGELLSLSMLYDSNSNW